MAGLPYMNMWWGDYFADTGHLTTEEHGAYLLLIGHYWMTGGLPAEPKQLASIARLSLARWTRISPIIQRFFHDGWHHKRVEKERSRAIESHDRRVVAGRRGGIEKARKISSNATALPEHCSSILEPEPRVVSIGESLGTPLESRKRTLSVHSAKIAAAPSESFERFWKAYPKRLGPNPKKPALKAFERELQRGFDPEAIIAGASRFAAEERKAGRIGTPYVCQAVTWLNQNRWGDYALPPERPANGHAVKTEPGPEDLALLERSKELFDEFGYLKPY